MASSIDASTSGAGGVITTADNTGILQLKTAGVVAVTVNASSALGVGTSPSFGTSGQVLTSSGTSAAPTWSTISSGGMTLLGTLTTTSGTTQTLSGLTLTNYKQVHIVGSGVSTTFVGGQAGGVLLGPNNNRLTNDGAAGTDTIDFIAFVDLTTGIYTSSYSINNATVNPSIYVRTSGLSTASTSIALSLSNSTSFDAGTVRIYGVA